MGSTGKRAGRLGDRSHVPRDSHGCSGCAHSAIGPAVTGSANVLINHRRALRTEDRGVHSTCCGSNKWKAVQGAPRVLINERRAHRFGDVDEHCGGLGEMVEGSPDVLIGDYVSSENIKTFTPQITLKDMPGPSGAPLINTPWALVLDWQVVERGKTDDAGRVQLQTKLKPGRIYELRYPGRTVEIVPLSSDPASTIKGMQIRLAWLGYHPGPINGRPSTRTTDALHAFQFDHELVPDGVYGSESQTKLVEVAGF